MNPVLCSDSIPSFLHFFDLSIAPKLLFYSYVPAVFAALCVGVFVYYKDRKSLAGRLLLFICLFFTGWVANTFVQWVAAYNDFVMFSWQLSAVFEVPLFFLSVQFAYVMTDKERSDAPDWLKNVFSLVMAVIFFLLPTKWNITLYNLSNCEGVLGKLWVLIYVIESLSVIWVIALCFVRFKALPKKDDFRKQILLILIGLSAFMILEVASDVLGYSSRLPDVAFLGAVGMVVFLGILAYMIVRYRLFNIKLIAAQASVAAIGILIGVQLLFPTNTVDLALSASTFIVFLIAGFFLIQSVKREIAIKETLKVTNERLEDTTSLITHQIRGVFTRTKAGLNSIIEGDYGQVDPKLLNVSNLMFESQEKGLNEVETFLQAQKIESGTIQYDRKPFDFKAVVEEIATQEKPRAEKKGLQFEVQTDAGDYLLNGDQVYLTQVIANLIDNAIRYTEKGSIKVQLSRKGDKLVYSVKDSGVGIKDEDKPKMFTKYGHGAESRKINAASSGLGLYIVKGILAGHSGDIRFETEAGKGTTFIVELPAK